MNYGKRIRHCDLQYTECIGNVTKCIQSHMSARQRCAENRQQMEEESAKRFKRVSNHMQKRLIEPLEEMNLTPEVIKAQTTAERLTLRIRLADDHQLAGHAPRPRASSDSLAASRFTSR